MRDHEQYEENVGAYLLGALPELEAEVFERHLMGCGACLGEVQRLRPAVEALPRSVPPLTPPESLKRSLMDVVREEARESAPSTRRSRRPGFFGMSLPQIRPATAWVSAAFVMAVGVVAGFGITQLGDGGDRSRTLTASVDRDRIHSGGASLIVPDEATDGGILTVHGLDQTVADQVYVVWVQRGDERIFESSFNVRPDGSGKAAIESLEGVDRVMVTRERSAGVAAPTEEPIIAIDTRGVRSS